MIGKGFELLFKEKFYRNINFLGFKSVFESEEKSNGEGG